MKLGAKVDQGSTLADKMDLQAEEAASTMRSPALFALKQRLFSKAASANALFKSVDINGDGVLSVDELTACCKKLVPSRCLCSVHVCYAVFSHQQEFSPARHACVSMGMHRNDLYPSCCWFSRRLRVVRAVSSMS